MTLREEESRLKGRLFFPLLPVSSRLRLHLACSKIYFMQTVGEFVELNLHFVCQTTLSAEGQTTSSSSVAAAKWGKGGCWRGKTTSGKRKPVSGFLFFYLFFIFDRTWLLFLGIYTPSCFVPLKPECSTDSWLLGRVGLKDSGFKPNWRRTLEATM